MGSKDRYQPVKTIPNFFTVSSFILISFQNSIASDADFSIQYYDSIAIVLLIFIVIILFSILYFERKDKVMDIIDAKPNRILFWFNSLIYGILIFLILYFIAFHIFAAKKYLFASTSEINSESEDGSEIEINEDNVNELTDVKALVSGKKIYDNNCIACHGLDGGGLVGPNLTDDYWIRGGGINNIFKIIKYGVPEKGMISWQAQLSAKQIQEVSSYILSLKGISPASPKSPEGQLWNDDE